VRARIRLELDEVLALSRAAADLGEDGKARQLALYGAALIGLLSDPVALAELAATKGIDDVRG
jgi:hypothetical protein